MTRLQAPLAAIAALALAAAGQAAGGSKMFKCVEGGRTIYQQQACALAAQPEPAVSAAKTATKPSAAAEAASAGRTKLKRPSPAASSAPATHR